MSEIWIANASPVIVLALEPLKGEARMFDPYHKWLGIPKDQRPPTFYQLLGLGPDEQDVEVIEEAAIRQSTHLRSYQIGQHAAECTRLLNEIGQARATLLNPEKRKKYDEELARKAAGKQAAEQAEKASRISKGAPRPAPVAANAFADLEEDSAPVVDSRRTLQKGRGGAGGNGKLFLLLGAAAAVPALAVVALLIFLLLPKAPAPQPNPKPPEGGGQQVVIAKNGPPDQPKVNPVVKPPVNPRGDPKPPVNPRGDPKPPMGQPKPEPAKDGSYHRTFFQFANHVAFAPDGSYFIADAAYKLHLCDPRTGQTIRDFTHEGKNGMTALAISPDSRLVLVGTSNKGALLMEVANGAVKAELPHESVVLSAVFSPDGKQVLTGSGAANPPGDNVVRLWNAETGELIRRYDGLSKRVHAVAFLPDGKVFGTNGSEACLWNKETGAVVNRYTLEKGTGEAPAVSPDGRWFATWIFWPPVPGSSVFGVYSTADGSLKNKITVDLPGRSGLAWSADSHFLLSGGCNFQVVKSVRVDTGGVAVLWEVATGKEVRRWKVHSKSTRSLAFAPDGKSAVASGWDPAIHLWPLQTQAAAANPGPAPQPVAQPKGKPGKLTELFRHTFTTQAGGRVAYSPDGTYFLARGDRGLYLFDAKTGQQLRPFDFNDASLIAVHLLSITPDSRLALSAGRSPHVRVWDVRTGKEVRKLQQHDSWVWAVAPSPDSKHVLTGSGDLAKISDTVVRLCELESGNILRKYEGLPGHVKAVAFSPDGGVLGSDGTELCRWDRETGQPAQRFPVLHPGRQVAAGPRHGTLCAFSPDARLLATYGWAPGKGNLVDVWATADGRHQATLTGPMKSLNALAWSPDSKRLLAADGMILDGKPADCRVLVWDVQTGQEVGRLEEEPMHIFHDVAVAPDGRQAVASCWDGSVRMLRLPQP